MKVALIISALVAVVVATPTSYDNYPTSYEKYPTSYENKYPTSYENKYPTSYEKKNYEYAPANYHYAYDVKDEYSYVNFGATENRYGDNTKGSYFVELPDGRTQMVNYYVDGYSGFVADVTYKGEAKYPDNYYKPKYQTTYPKAAYTAPSYDSYVPKYEKPTNKKKN